MDDNTIAVIGVAGRFPGADSVDALWELVVGGGSGLQRVDVDSTIPGRSLLVPVHGTASGLDLFDPADFGMTSREAVDCDPQTRLLLQLVESVFRDAGYAPGGQPDTAVYVTAGHSRYSELFGPIDWGSSRGMSLMTGTNTDYTSSMLSYKYGFRGASVTVQTACSSSLVAVHHACQALLDGHTDLALAGGANVVLPLESGYSWEQGGPLSRSGACRPFDDAADGTVFTSGGALVLLKRLSDARRDGDHVYAVIAGGAVNNDGAHKAGFTAPSVIGQAAVIAEAMMDAGIGPDDLDAIEGHATGTTLGDAIEWEGVLRAFELAGGRSVGPCSVTAVKGNVGHLGHASGIVSLINAVMAVHHQLIPAIAGFTTPNTRLTTAPEQLSLPTTNLSGPVRHCGVSSFGIGGTNAHLVVGAAPHHTPARVEESLREPVLLGWAETSDIRRDAYRGALAASRDRNVQRIANSLAEINTHASPRFRHRAATVVEPHEDWRAVLAADPAVVHHGPETTGLGWVFPGEGSLPATGVAGIPDNPRTASAFAACADAFSASEIDLAECMSRFASGSRAAVVTEPLILATSYALGVAWRDLGSTPDFVAGRGVGEFCAGVFADVLDLEDACRLVAHRARALDALPPVLRLSIVGPRDRVKRFLSLDRGNAIIVVADDDLGRVTVEGAPETVEPLTEQAVADGLHIRLEDGAYPAGSFHAAADLTDVTVSPRPGSSTAPTHLSLAAVDESPGQASYWWAITAAGVRDDRLVERVDTADALMLEVGAGSTGTALINRLKPGRAVASLPDGADRPDQVEYALLQAAARVWAAGHDLDWSTLRKQDAGRARLPGRAVSGTRHWPSTPAPVVDTTVVPSMTHERFPGLKTTTPGWARAFDAESASPPSGRKTLGILIGECGPELERVIAKTAPTSAPMRLPLSGDLREQIVSVMRSQADEGLDHLVLGLGACSNSATDTVAEQWQTGFGAVAAAGAGLHAASLTSCDLTVVTTKGIDVTGDEPLLPGRAAVGPLLRTLVQEGSVARGAWCDVSSTTRHVNVPYVRPTRDVPFVAVRGRRIWSEHRSTVGPGQTVAKTPTGAHYLITGGTGALAGVLARHIARLDPAARITLMARRHREPTEAHREAAALGADLRVAVCDLSRIDSVATVVDDAVTACGPLHAVYHLAGAPGAGVTALADHSRSEAVQAKVYGTEALVHALERHRPPSLLVGFSSRAALTGQPGGGDYAAANAVMEALLSRAPAERIVNIAWAAWAEVGMAVPFLRTPQGDARAAISTADAEVLLNSLLTDEFPDRVLVEVTDEDVAASPPNNIPPQEMSAGLDVQTSTADTGDESVVDALAAIWGDLLGTTEVDLDADFFESGGQLPDRRRIVVAGGRRTGDRSRPRRSLRSSHTPGPHRLGRERRRMMDHLPHLVTGWRTWPRFVVRHAGFPAALAFALSDPELAEAADKRIGEDGPVRNAEFDAAFERAATRMTATLRDNAADPRFREAVGWQNPKLISTCLDKVVRGEPRNVRGRNHEATVAAYSQRYGLKNDTIGFFGPVGWGEWGPGTEHGISWAENATVGGRRVTYHECWAIDAIAETFCADPAARPFLVPRLSGAVSVTGRLVRGGPSLRFLNERERAVVDVSDGDRDLRTIAGLLAWGVHAELGDLDRLWTVVSHLVDTEVLEWTWLGPIEARPERRLRARLELIADPKVRTDLLGRLDEYLQYGAAVHDAEGDVERLGQAFDDLGKAFEHITGREASRRDGQNYAGRTLVYQDMRSEVNVVADELLRKHMEPLGTVLDSANWLTDQVAERYRRLFGDLFDGEAEDGRLPLSALLSRATPHLYLTVRDVPALVKDARAELQQRWTRIHGAYDGGPDVTLPLEEVRERALREFGPPGEPAWPTAYCHSPDMMVAGNGDDLSTGRSRVVLGELHVAVNTLESRVFVEQSGDADAMVRAAELSSNGTRYYAVAAKKWPWVTSRLSPPTALLSPRFRYWSLHAPSIEAPGGCTPAADLSVTRVNGELRVLQGDGEDYGPLIHVVGELLAASVANAFSVAPPWRRRPRITVGGLVLARRGWTFDASDIRWADINDERTRFVEMRRWRRAEGIPERAFYKVPIDDKPLYVDGSSIVFVNTLAKAIRQTAAKNGTVTFTEMLPDEGELWLERGGRLHTGEFRFVAVPAEGRRHV
ncbi:MAG TPA: SDR family NAD(P)-dependent oxidoreductase [Candidatus Stackebrandtia excrementipullorum]|nr:SDR family NAD(P)-dependent oxidoreductase [Candidatus Stackebrandtia excrementipullorum]